MNDLRNFNEIFKKNMTYNNIKSHKKARLYRLSEKYIPGKTTGGVNSTAPAFLGLI